MSVKRFPKIFTKIEETILKTTGKIFARVMVVGLITLGISSFLFIYIYKFAISNYEIANQYELFRDILVVVLAIVGVVVAVTCLLVHRAILAEIEKASHQVSLEFTEKMKKVTWNSRAHTERVVGYLMWTQSVMMKDPKEKAKLLNAAIKRTERAYFDFACRLDESVPENELLICNIKNNLAYFYAEKHDPADKEIAREYANYIYKKSKKHPVFEADWVDTYKFVMLKYPNHSSENTRVKK